MLRTQWDLPESAASKSCDTFLEQFRKCPDDCLHDLDGWRTLLWTSALSHDYKHLAGEVHVQRKIVFIDYYLLTTTQIIEVIETRLIQTTLHY